MDLGSQRRGLFSKLSRSRNRFKRQQMLKGYKFDNSATFAAFIPFLVSETALSIYFVDNEFTALSTYACRLHGQCKNSRCYYYFLFVKIKVVLGVSPVLFLI